MPGGEVGHYSVGKLSRNDIMLSNEIEADAMGQFGRLPEQEETPQEQLRNYLKTLPLSQRRAYVASMRGQRQASQPFITQGNTMNDHGDSQAFGAYNYANAMHNAQGDYLQGMANDVMGAIARENNSRVAQSREQRRMEHEQMLERMRQETEQMKINALIQRLNQQGAGDGFRNPAEGLFIR